MAFPKFGTKRLSTQQLGVAGAAREEQMVFSSHLPLGITGAEQFLLNCS